MRTLRFAPSLLLLAAVAVLVAGCGGGGPKSVPQNAVAVVGSDTITKQQYNDLLDAARRNYEARKADFPKVGTDAYKALSDQAMLYLVQESELEQKAKDLGVEVTDGDIDARIEQIKTQYFGGSEKRFRAALKAQGVTESQLRQDIHAQILSTKLYDKVTAGVTVTDSEVSAYYRKHKADYTTPASREVRHILVNDKRLALELEAKLRGGADFAALAKRYSKDTESAKVGGKLCVAHGRGNTSNGCFQTVPAFDKVAFSLRTNEISKPVHTTYGWHIIQALGPVKPAQATPLKDVREQIRQSLLSTKKTKTMTRWVDDVKKEFASEIAYQAGYAPASTATTGTTG